VSKIKLQDLAATPGGPMDRLGGFIDRAVAAISPGKAMLRMESRIRLRKASRALTTLESVENTRRQDDFRLNKRELYAAAKTTRLTGAWSPSAGNVNDILRGSTSSVRARVRQLIRDFPVFKRAADIIVEYTVGGGIPYQSRVLKDAKGTAMDEAVNNAIEEAWEEWMEKEHCDIAKKLHFYEIQRLMARSQAADGEFLLAYRLDPRRKNPFALQVYEAEWLTSIHITTQAPGTEIDQGVEYDIATGEVKAYHFQDPRNYAQAKRVPVELILHGFQSSRPNQLRGISELVSAVLIAHDFSDYIDTEIDAAKIAAKWLAFVEAEDISGLQAAATDGEGVDAGKKIETLENCIIEYLRPGEKMNFNTSNRPGTTFLPMIRLMLRMISIAGGFSYELLSGDYEGISYSNLRGIRNDVNYFFRSKSIWFIRNHNEPIKREWMKYAVLSGQLKLPGYFANPRRYWTGVFTPPGQEPVDPLRETKSRLDEISQHLRSPQEVITARGRQPEQVLAEIAQWNQWVDDLGLQPEEVSTALANNPAKIMDQDKKKRDLLAEFEDLDADELELMRAVSARLTKPNHRNGNPVHVS
jgi:lambda family phage portal protein